MKIAAVLIILSVYYIASTEQRASGPAYVYKTLEETEHGVQQGMKDFKMRAGKAFTHAQDAKAQYDVLMELYDVLVELFEYAHQDCGSEERSMEGIQ